MSNYIKLAKAYSKAGYSVIPVGTNKIPTIKEWRQYQDQPMTEQECEKHFKNAYGMALLCGGKNNVTAIDVDLKNDLSGDFYQRMLDRVPSKIKEKMYIQKTQNNGYHLVFSCPDKCENNQKIVSRFTTSDERHQVYIENYENPVTKDKAFKIASNYNTLCIVETRGAGGYILISPTKGYTQIQGKIQVISKYDYDILFNSIREMDHVNKVIKKDSRYDKNKSEWKVSPFKDFNENGDMIHLLESNGWIRSGRPHGRNQRFKRPGKSSPTSAILDTDTKILSVFSTSTDLDINRGYSATDLYTQFECNGDIGKCYEKLVEQGYGIK